MNRTSNAAVVRLARISPKARLVTYRRGHLYLVMTIGMIDGSPIIVPHHLSGRPAELEWWQQDHVILGMSVHTDEKYATDAALTMAEIGDTSRLDLTAWLDRVTPRLLFFKRGPRDSRYRPKTRCIPEQEIATIIVGMQ
jgi:hypothetical protein